MTTPFRHAGFRLAVRLPTVGEVLSLWMRSSLKDGPIVDVLRPAEVRRFVVRPDGSPVDPELARAIVASPPAYQAYREARHAELASATEGGTITAECPHCRRWRAALAPLAVAVVSRSPFPPLVDPWGDLAVPAAAEDGSRGVPVPGPVASRLWLTLPGRRGGPLLFGDAGERDRLVQWQARSRAFFAAAQAPGGVRQDWTPDAVGWVALLRLASAVPGLVPDERPGSADLEPPGTGSAVQQMLALTRVSLADVLFADTVTWLTRVAPVPPDAGPAIRCASCAGEFLPLGASPDWALDEDRLTGRYWLGSTAPEAENGT